MSARYSIVLIFTKYIWKNLGGKKKTSKIFPKDFHYLQFRLFIPDIREFDETEGQGTSDFKYTNK